jgi:hypothetical protein
LPNHLKTSIKKKLKNVCVSLPSNSGRKQPVLLLRPLQQQQPVVGPINFAFAGKTAMERGISDGTGRTVYLIYN